MNDLDDDTALRARLHQDLDDLAAPRAIGAGAIAVGRRLRRRRRTATIGGCLAASAAATTLVATMAGQGAEGARPGFGADTTPPSLAPTSTPPPATSSIASPATTPASGSPTSTADVWWEKSAPRLARTLAHLLPAGVTVVSTDVHGDPAPGEPRTSHGTVSGTLRGPEGLGSYQLILSPPLETNAARVTCPVSYAVSCDVVLDRGTGEQVGRVDVIHQGDITFYEATYLHQDGGLVYLTAFNSSVAKPGIETPAGAPAPPLTPGQLSRLARDPAWTS